MAIRYEKLPYSDLISEPSVFRQHPNSASDFQLGRLGGILGFVLSCLTLLDV